MDILTPTFWLTAGLLAAALVVSYIFPPLGALLGVIGGLLLLWMLLGGGR